MAGLLGDGWEDPQSQMIMGLAQGLLSARGGAGLAAGIGGMQAAQQNGMKNKLIGAQLDNYRSEIEARKLAGVKDARMQAAIEGFYGGNSAAPAQPGQIGSGSFGITPLAPGVDAMPQGVGRSGLANKSLDEVTRFSQLTGKDLLPAWKLAKEGIERKPGTFYDSVTGGPREYIGDPTKGLGFKDGRINLMPGSESIATLAGDSAGAIARAQAGQKPIKVWNPATQREEFTNEAVVTGGQQPGRTGNPMIDAVAQTESGGNPNAVSPKGARGVMQVMPSTNTAPGFGVTPARDGSEAERTRVGQDYLGKMQERYKDPALAAIAYNWGPGNTDMWLQSGGDFKKLPAETQSYVAQVLTRNGVNGRAQQSGNFAAGPSASEAAAAKASEARAVDTAKADVVRETGQQKEGKLYGQLTAGLDRAISLLAQGPTASGAGALADSAAGFFGKSTKGADTASQLDTISGWLSSNVPRMEGPQSDRDVQQYRIMAAEVGDRTKPVSQRLAAAKELQGLQAKYAELNGGTANTGGATGSFGDKPKAAQTFDTKPPAQNFKGKTATGPDGKRYKSDGMIWKEVQ